MHKRNYFMVGKAQVWNRTGRSSSPTSTPSYLCDPMVIFNMKQRAVKAASHNYCENWKFEILRGKSFMYLHSKQYHPHHHCRHHHCHAQEASPYKTQACQLDVCVGIHICIPVLSFYDKVSNMLM